MPNVTQAELYGDASPLPDLSAIERYYESERALMDAVSKGRPIDPDSLDLALLDSLADRTTAAPLRACKNQLITLNTLLRKAAEVGAVPPIHIYRLCATQTLRIEELTSLDGAIELQRSMVEQYCLLVKEHSLKQYSHIIARTITLISSDLGADLTLNSIARRLNVNASYLSALFKRECGETLTAFVIRKRMESAAFSLRHTEKQIQTIAEEVGVLDVNYFIKLFKRQYQMTPSRYRTLPVQ